MDFDLISLPWTTAAAVLPWWRPPGCAKYLFCGIPIPDSRYMNARLNGTWLPREQPVETIPKKPMEVLSRTVLDDGKTLRLVIRIDFTDHSSLFIEPLR